MNQISTQQQAVPAKRERIDVLDAVPLLDTGRFEHMQRVATVMARSTLMPESLYMTGKKDDKEPLPYDQILSNCFLVVNQAVRWGLDPFAVAQCVSVVHGKLCYEGKLVSAVLQAKMGLSLHHHFTGEGDAMRVYLSDKPFTDDILAGLRPGYRRQDMRVFDGSVGDWKTTGSGTPWTPKNFPRMLIYRGTRDWCRIYEPALMLGVYTDDEMVDMEEASRFRSARNITPQVIDDPLSDEPVASQHPADEQEPFSAPITADEPHDALTGEIINKADDGSLFDSRNPNNKVTDTDETALSQSVDAGMKPAEGEVENPPAASPSNDPERDILIRFAAEMLPMAANINVSPSTLKEVEKGWSEGEMKSLTAEGKEKARSISMSIRAIANGKASLESAIEFYSEMLGCKPSDLGASDE